jgi:translocation and assembly module TamB
MRLAGQVTINGANINIPKSLPPSVANLPIINRGETPPPPPPSPPNVALNLLVRARDKIFVRGDGLFAELGGRLQITGTAADPDPEGGFTLIRGDFALAGKNLQFTSGTVSFNGDGFMPTLDLEATATSNNVTSTLVVGGTAAQPTITLTSTPPAPSDEILANLLFGTGTQNLTAFQAASLAAALAQLSGVGGGGNPLDSVRSALGLDQLSLGGSGSGPPSIEAGRYVAPGIYVGATQATVEINLYKGLKLDTATGTSGSGSGAASSVGLTYQFNY